jgi:PAS domain S-box-containing protein
MAENELTRLTGELQTSQATLQSFYDSVPFMMGIAELDGNKTVAVSANRAMAAFLDTQLQNISGQTGRALGTPADFERMLVKSYKRCQQEGTPVRFEYEYPHASGKRWLDTAAAFIGIGPTGNPWFSFVAQDVTERKQAEAALHKMNETLEQRIAERTAELSASEQKFATIFERSPIAIGISRLKDNLFADINPAMCELFGYTREEMLGHSSLELGLWIDPSERKRMIEQLEKHGRVTGFETANRSKSGRRIEISIAAQIVEINRELYLLGQIMDITERKRVEQALAEANAKLEKLFEVLPVGISVLDQGGQVVKQNPMLENILGISMEGLVRGDYRQREYLHPDGTKFQADEFPSARILRGEAMVQDIEIGAVKEDGQIIWMRVSAAAVPFPDWKAVIATRDITAQMQAEQALHKSDERFSRAFHGNPAVQLISRADNGQFLDVNEACCRLLGREHDELIGHKASELNFWVDSAEQQQKIEATRRAGSLGPFEVNVSHKSGELRTLVVSSETIEFNGLKALISTAIDITESKQSEEALRESEQKFSTVFKQSPIAMGVVRLKDSRYVDVNDAMLNLFGYSHEEFIGKTSKDLGLWADLPERQHFFEQLFTEKHVNNFEMIGRQKPGASLNLLVSAQVIEINQEEYVVGQIIDITERKRDEARLRYQATLLANVNDAIIATDKNTIITSWNKAAERIYGWSAEEAIGQAGSLLLKTETMGGTRKESLEKLHLTGEMITELAQTRKDGERILVEAHISVIRGANDQIAGYMTTNLDITERKRAESTMRLSEEKFRTLADSIQDIFFAFDQNLRYTYWNKASEALTGIPSEQAIGKSLFEIFSKSPETLRAEKVYREVLNSGVSQTFLTEFTLHGTIAIYEVRAYPLAGGISVFTRDITAQKRMQRELEQSHAQLQALSRQLLEAQEQERRAIGRELHDEIGQTLTGLTILLEMAQRLPAAENYQKLAQAQQAAGELIDRVSALSLDLRPPMLDDLGILPTLVWFMDRYTSQTDVRVDFHHAGLQNRRFEPALETAVYRLVQEALTNVARHAKTNDVFVSINARETEIEIFIDDGGAGFEMLAKPDTGGLSGMRERIRLLEGTLEIASTSGQGTHIFIRLPINQES